MASIPSLPDVRETLDLAQSISTASGDQHRRLLKQLASAIELQGRERILRIKWAPGGESIYRVPQFRGGPGRSVEESMEMAREQLAEFRLSLEGATPN